ncbi:uncharacterized protein [Physcomitrium patens]|uniref:Ubiquitin-like domain-containing protein n=1 Tax=Physcomitrium patens TaxID=3218 RepID=A0A2K1L9W6_PHYPA|nr:uncharacterized protein LOC112279809 [Physcomitrium patens]PNR62811.1 hypothetical protein PHYPA_001235 [Physcomitrium patens]|eukprot:XP_024370306.1 uncharacterized protein LOC112279809 [Physcomitrella patens]
MVRVGIRTAGSTRRRIVDLPAESEVGWVRQAIAHEFGAPHERLKLIVGGKALEDEMNTKPVTVKFADGDSLIAVVVPKAPPKHISSRDGEIEDEDEELRFKLPESATPLQRQLGNFLRGKLKVPDIFLIVLFSISPRAWLSIAIWFVLLPIARRWELGPVYIIITVFAVIFMNLGKRQPGEASAYSIFNDDFRELPGTLNADRLDRDIRAGQF